MAYMSPLTLTFFPVELYRRYIQVLVCLVSSPPRAAVLMVPIDPSDGVFRLAVTHPDDKISDQPPLRNPEMDGSASGRIPLAPSGAS
jgi:hypothetical protein